MNVAKTNESNLNEESDIMPHLGGRSNEALGSLAMRSFQKRN